MQMLLTTICNAFEETAPNHFRFNKITSFFWEIFNLASLVASLPHTNTSHTIWLLLLNSHLTTTKHSFILILLLITRPQLLASSWMSIDAKLWKSSTENDCFPILSLLLHDVINMRGKRSRRWCQWQTCKSFILIKSLIYFYKFCTKKNSNK